MSFGKGMHGRSAATARRHLEKALELASSSTERADMDLLPEIKEVLAEFNDLMDGPLGSLYFADLPFAMPSPARPARARPQPLPRGRSRRGNPLQLIFPAFFDDNDEMTPDWSLPEEPPETSRHQSGTKRSKRS